MIWFKVHNTERAQQGATVVVGAANEEEARKQGYVHLLEYAESNLCCWGIRKRFAIVGDVEEFQPGQEWFDMAEGDLNGFIIVGLQSG